MNPVDAREFVISLVSDSSIPDSFFGSLVPAMCAHYLVAMARRGSPVRTISTEELLCAAASEFEAENIERELPRLEELEQKDVPDEPCPDQGSGPVDEPKPWFRACTTEDLDAYGDDEEIVEDDER